MRILKSNWLLFGLMLVTFGLTVTSLTLANDHLMHDKVFKELNLTPEQKEKIKKLKEEKRDSLKDDRKEMREAAQEFKKKISGNTSDEDLKKEFSNLQSKRSEFAKQKFEHMLKIRAVLTPEQRTKFSNLMEKKMEKFHRKGKHARHHDEQEEDDDDAE